MKFELTIKHTCGNKPVEEIEKLLKSVIDRIKTDAHPSIDTIDYAAHLFDSNDNIIGYLTWIAEKQ